MTNATWLTSPGSDDFKTGSNWTGGAVPDGIATFGSSSRTALTFSAETGSEGWHFSSGGPAYSFRIDQTLHFNGETAATAGIIHDGNGPTITNLLGGDLKFENASTASGGTGAGTTIDNFGVIRFYDTSTAGSATITQSATLVDPLGFFYGQIQFNDHSTAGTAHITNSGLENFLQFYANTSADHATIVNGGQLQFLPFSTAAESNITNNNALKFARGATSGNATIINNGSMSFLEDSYAGYAHITNNDSLFGLYFSGDSTADVATIVNYGTMLFYDHASGGIADITNSGTLSFINQSAPYQATITTKSGGTTFLKDTVGAGGVTFITESGGVVDVSGITNPGVAMNSIAGAGEYRLGSRTLSVGSFAATTTTMSGSIKDGGDSDGTGAGLNKIGVLDTLILSGTNLYTGATIVSGGTLQVDGSIASSSGVTVKTGGTLGGKGTVSGVSVESGGTLSPGASAGQLHTGTLSFAAGATFAVELGGATAGTEYDQLAVTGAVHLAGTLGLSFIGAFEPDIVTATNFVIIDNDGTADAVSGTFAGLADGAEFNFNHRLFAINYDGGDGNDVVLTSAGASIAGTAGVDVIDGTHAPSGEHVATELRDVIDGAGGNDQLSGLGGNDTLIGGAGKDRMTGGLGADVFDFNLKTDSAKGANRDVITDFRHGTDRIDLHDIDANSKIADDQDFKWIGGAKFHHKAGELHFVKMNKPGAAHDKTMVEGDINGDGKADFQVELSHLIKLNGADFIL